MTVCGRIRLRVLAYIALALGVAPLAPFCGAKAAENHALAMHGAPALPRDFTQEDGEVTPTLKLRRKIVHEHFADAIDELYS